MDGQASELVAACAGGAFEGSLNLYGTGGNTVVCTVQIDELVYVIGQDDFNVGRYTLDEWLGISEQADPPFIQADDAQQSLELLDLLRRDALLWQCGACDAWIYTSVRPRIGVLRCSTCGDDGVDFRHADRHVGSDS